METFATLMKKREEASVAFVNGDITPLLDLSTKTDPATIFGPGGDCVQGAKAVNDVNTAGSQNFKQGSTTNFEVMHSEASGGMAYWTGIQRSVVQIKGQAKPVPMDLRVTEIFRMQDGQWKLVHRHADMLKE